MKIVKTLLLLSAFLVGNYFISVEVFDIQSSNILIILLCTLLTSLVCISVTVILLGMFALFYNILGMDN